jgi:hypothetical protein
MSWLLLRAWNLASASRWTYKRAYLHFVRKRLSNHVRILYSWYAYLCSETLRNDIVKFWRRGTSHVNVLIEYPSRISKHLLHIHAHTQRKINYRVTREWIDHVETCVYRWLLSQDARRVAWTLNAASLLPTPIQSSLEFQENSSQKKNCCRATLAVIEPEPKSRAPSRNEKAGPWRIRPRQRNARMNAFFIRGTRTRGEENRPVGSRGRRGCACHVALSPGIGSFAGRGREVGFTSTTSRLNNFLPRDLPGAITRDSIKSQWKRTTPFINAHG